MSRRSRSKYGTLSWSSALPLALTLLTLWGLQQCTGLDVLAPRSVTETVSGDWIAVYFTAPHTPDDPANHAGGIDADLTDLIESGRESVDVAAYDLDLESVAEALIQAQGDGVRVRVVVDGTNVEEEAVTRLREARVPIVARPDQGWGIMHNKFVVVDGVWVWTGSWNLTDNGTYRNNNNAVVIASRYLAQDYATEFEELYSGRFGPSSPAETPYPVVTLESGDRSAQLEVYFAPEDRAADRLVEVLSSAQANVRFLAFQFTSPRIADVLIDLAGRGVTVQGIVEARSAGSSYSEFERLRTGGVDVLPDGNPYIMHHKVFIVDSEVVVLGSYNFTVSADENNDENLLIIHDSEVAAAFLGEFGRVLQEAQTAVPEG
jgi:phosphatidylserine/phosphatidylglycerophosphate/cardiolipin synthase-like enzyme